MSFFINQQDTDLLGLFVDRMREGDSVTKTDLANLKELLFKMETEACTIHDAQELLEWENHINDFAEIIKVIEDRLNNK